jgi:hypothetical protein
MPAEELLTVPEEWLLHRCPHRPDGFRLQLVPEHHDEKEMAAEQSVWGVSVWRDSIDATKTLAIRGVNPESTVLTPHTTLSTTNPIHSRCVPVPTQFQLLRAIWRGIRGPRERLHCVFCCQASSPRFVANSRSRG